MTLTKTALTALLSALSIGAATAPAIASAKSCAATKTHTVRTVAHRRVTHRPVAVAAYRERAPRTITRTVVETRYIHEPARVIVTPAPAYYHDAYYHDYAPYPVY